MQPSPLFENALAYVRMRSVLLRANVEGATAGMHSLVRNKACPGTSESEETQEKAWLTRT
jgi:hypothetical protein